MSEVRVEIDGRSYRIACGEGEEERLTSLAADLDGTVAALRLKLGELGDRRIMVMAALTVLDRLRESEQAAADLKERLRMMERSREEAVLAAEAVDEPLIARIEALAAVVDRVTATLRAGTRRTHDGGPEAATFGRAPSAAADPATAPPLTAEPAPEPPSPPHAPTAGAVAKKPAAAASSDLDRVVPSFLKRP